MKPLFEQERIMLSEQLGVIIPRYSWKNTRNEVFFDVDDSKPFFKFKMEDGLLQTVMYNNSRIIDENYIYQRNSNNFKPVTPWAQEYMLNKKTIEAKFKQSKKELKTFLKAHPKADVRISVSGGKDSSLAYYVSAMVLDSIKRDFTTDFFNTSNEVAQTYLHVKNNYRNLQIHNPEKGWLKWIEEDKNYYIPSVMVRNCCDTYKEGQLHKVLDKDKEYVILLGVRKSESTKRSQYDFDLNKAMVEEVGKELNVPENWRRFAPVVQWEDHEVWLFLLFHNIPVNPIYAIGYNRVGCIICPYSRPYVDYLTKTYFNGIWSRWENVLIKNYEVWNVQKRLHWTLEEWVNGEWKEATSKIYKLTKLKATPERVKEVAEIKGISEKLALKYFNKTCGCCSTDKAKKLNPDEIGLNLKYFGRYEDATLEQEENRTYYCKKCMCKHFGWKQKDFTAKVVSLRESGCELV